MNIEAKEKNITLDGRLSCAASLVRNDSVVADIGTDHAYLPIYLLSRGTAKFAIASDVNRGPLDRAVAHAEEYGMTDRMRFTLADGLCGIEPEKEGVTDIVICGMGGELIAKIIGASDYTKKSGVRLILQPMTCAAELREFLAENGYEIVTERLCKAAGKIYTCIAAEYDGQKRNFDAVELLLGTHHIAAHDPLFRDFASSFAQKYETKINGLKTGGHDTSADEAVLYKLKKLIAESEDFSDECN